MKRIHRVAILGAGTMGARIAAHFANVRRSELSASILFPPTPTGLHEIKIAAAGLDAAKKVQASGIHGGVPVTPGKP